MLAGAYLALLAFAPPGLRGISIIDTGARLDHLLLLCLACFLVIRRSNALGEALRTPIGLMLMLFWLLSGLTALSAEVTRPAAQSAGLLIGGLWGDARPVLVFACVFALAREWGAAMRVRVSYWLVGVAVCAAFVGLAQLFHVEPLYSITVELYARKTHGESVLEALQLGRVYGTFDGQPNAFGSYCAICLTLALSLAADGSRTLGRAVVAGLTCLLLAFTLAVTWSRGAYAGALVAFAILLLAGRLKRSARLFGAGVFAASFLYAILPHGAVVRILQLATGTGYLGEAIYSNRLPYWSHNIELWKSAPLLGIRGSDLAPFDSLFVAVPTLYGLLGVCALVLLFGLVLRAAWMQALHEPCIRQLALALVAVSVGLFVNGVSIPTFFTGRVEETYWFLVALVVAPLPPSCASEWRHTSKRMLSARDPLRVRDGVS